MRAFLIFVFLSTFWVSRVQGFNNSSVEINNVSKSPCQGAAMLFNSFSDKNLFSSNSNGDRWLRQNPNGHFSKTDKVLYNKGGCTGFPPQTGSDTINCYISTGGLFSESRFGYISGSTKGTTANFEKEVLPISRELNLIACMDNYLGSDSRLLSLPTLVKKCR